MRGARLALLPLAGVALLAGAPPAGATAPPPTSTTAVAAATTTVPATTVAPTTTTVAQPATTLPRAGSAIGSLDRRSDDETWSVRRIATATLLGIAALAITGHIYGRIQSVTPRVGRTVARRDT